MTKDEITQLWIAEYSPSQKAIHVQQVEEAIKRNARLIRAGVAIDYMMIGMAETHDEASSMCREFRESIEHVRNLAQEEVPA